MLAVRNESAQRIVEIAQTPQSEGGRMHVQSGFLRASCLAFTGSSFPAATAKPDGPGVYTFDDGQIGLVIAGADLDEVITVVWTANYARHREYGANGQAPDAFVRMATQQWGRIVGEVCVEAKGRATR